MTDARGGAGAGTPAHRRPNERHREHRAAPLHAQPLAVRDAATDYARRGWPALPIAPAGKRPLTPHGALDATTDLDVIGGWYRRWPTAGVGIATDGLLVLDVDPRNGGNDTLERLVHELGALPATVTCDTGGGGLHLYFWAVDGPLRGKLGAGLDVKRGRGHYVLAPPSLHASRRRYTWRTGLAPAEIALTELPGAWLTRLRRAPAPARGPVPVRVGHRSPGDRIERARRYVARMPAAVAGQGGHRALWLVALAVVRGFALELEDALDVLRDYSTRCVPPWSERELLHKVADATRADAPLGYLVDREVRRVA